MSNKSNTPDNRVLSSLLARNARLLGGRKAIDHQAFLGALVDSRLLVPVSGGQRMPDGRISHLEFVVVNRDGRRSLPAFTDDEAVRLYFGDGDEQGLYILGGRELCQTAVRAGLDSILINPGGPAGYEMPRHEFHPIAEGLSHQPGGMLSASKRTEFLVGRPSNLPIDEHQLRQLRSAAQRADVTSAYWTWVKVGGGEPRIAIVVSPPDEGAVRAVQQILESTWDGDEVYVLALSPSSSVAQNIRNEGDLLFEKSR